MSAKSLKWHEGRMVSFDCEATGVNPAEDRIVTAATVHHAPEQRPRAIEWIINPGIDIPAEAAEVHGWTNDRLAQRLNGAEAVRILNGHETRIARDTAIFEIAAQVATSMGREEPLIVFNAAYDLTLLDAEAVRNDVPTVASRPWGLSGVIDPFVLDRQHDPYRKSCYDKTARCDRDADVHVCGGCRGGKVRCGGCGATNRKLTSLCQHYKVVHTGAHDATADALATLRLTSRIVAAWPDIARSRLATLHQKQIGWRKEQQDSLRSFFEKKGKEHDGMCPEWPIHSACTPALAGVA